MNQDTNNFNQQGNNGMFNPQNQNMEQNNNVNQQPMFNSTLNNNMYQQPVSQNNVPNTNPTNNSPKQNKTKIIGIVVAVVVVLFVGIMLFGGGYLNGGHKNMTGSTEYKDSDVDLNCTREDSNDKRDKKEYSDFIFNYEYGGGKGIYQAREYGKIVLEYKSALTDDEYQRVINEIGGSAFCIDKDDCAGSHLEIPISKIGFDTVVDRIGNKIEITFRQDYGHGTTITSEEKKKLEDSFEGIGYNCN